MEEENLPQDQSKLREVLTNLNLSGSEATTATFDQEVVRKIDLNSRTLAKWWDKEVKKAIDAGVDLDRIGKNIDSAAHEIYFLSWLELAKIRKTQDGGLGKFGLFSMGKWFEEHEKSKS